MSKLWCFFGVHDWKIIAKGPYVQTYVDSNERKEGHWFHLRCDRCGNLKYKKLV
jgi:hypothetical protein